MRTASRGCEKVETSAPLSLSLSSCNTHISSAISHFGHRILFATVLPFCVCNRRLYKTTHKIYGILWSRERRCHHHHYYRQYSTLVFHQMMAAAAINMIFLRGIVASKSAAPVLVPQDAVGKYGLRPADTRSSLFVCDI